MKFSRNNTSAPLRLLENEPDRADTEVRELSPSRLGMALFRAYLSRHSHRLATDPLRIAAFLLRALPPARLVVMPCTARASNAMLGPAYRDRLLIFYCKMYDSSVFSLFS